jgi:uncharacterized membrane protein
MSHIEHAVEVEVPVRAAYDQWTQFESFPDFMTGVERVEQLDDRRLEWTAEILGQRRTWQAEITRQEPDRCVSWTSTSGPRNQGTVTFQPLGPDRTEVTLVMDVEPEGAADKLGDAIGVLDRQVGDDLSRFRKFIEGRGRETGAWRKTIGGTH